MNYVKKFTKNIFLFQYSIHCLIFSALLVLFIWLDQQIEFIQLLAKFNFAHLKPVIIFFVQISIKLALAALTYLGTIFWVCCFLLPPASIILIVVLSTLFCQWANEKPLTDEQGGLVVFNSIAFYLTFFCGACYYFDINIIEIIYSFLANAFEISKNTLALMNQKTNSIATDFSKCDLPMLMIIPILVQTIYLSKKKKRSSPCRDEFNISLPFRCLSGVILLFGCENINKIFEKDFYNGLGMFCVFLFASAFFLYLSYSDSNDD